jgi:hypothetical protein
MDFITDLPKTTVGHDAVCVFVDKLTKMVHIAPTTSSYDAPELAQLFLREICRYHGFPQQILHDRGQQFMSQFLQSFARVGGFNSCQVQLITPRQMARQNV